MWKRTFAVLFVVFIHAARTGNTSANGTRDKETSRNALPQPPNQIRIARWEFEKHRQKITIILLLCLVILIKIAFRKIRHVPDYIPECLLLLAFGSILGATGYRSHNDQLNFNGEIFFSYLLPPVVLESSYCLYNRTFGEYLEMILLFAILGTVFSFLIIGFGMYGLHVAGALGPPMLDIDVNTCLLFSSLIVAVDPVAVLSIFQSMGAEINLYCIVFGESLMNDAITVVLYEILSTFGGQDEVTGQRIGIGVASFFTISFGGLLVGVLAGVTSCLLTRIKNRLSAFILILLAYFSYIITDVVGWSGIIAMIGCGTVQAAYAFNNLDRKSVTLVRRLTKLVAELCESIVFLFLGLEVVSDQLVWHWGFMLWGLVLCLVARTMVVFGISAIVNWVHGDSTRISFTEQLILIYGGLRGAVAFSLALMINADTLGEQGVYNRQLIITETLFIVFSSATVVGLTMKPLLVVLNIQREAKRRFSLCDELQNNVVDEILTGIEVIAGLRGRNVIRSFIKRIDEKYIRPFLQRDPVDYGQNLLKTDKKSMLRFHTSNVALNRVHGFLENVSESLENRYLTHAYSGLSHSAVIPSSWFGQGMKNMQQSPTKLLGSTQRRPNDGSLERSSNEAAEIVQCIQSNEHMNTVGYETQQVDFNSKLEDFVWSFGRQTRWGFSPEIQEKLSTCNRAYLTAPDTISDLRWREAYQMGGQKNTDLENKKNCEISADRRSILPTSM